MTYPKPEVGHMVHFYNTALDAGANNGTGAGPYAAIVTQDFKSGPYVNLKIMPYGDPWDEGSVSHKEDSGENPTRYWVYPAGV